MNEIKKVKFTRRDLSEDLNKERKVINRKSKELIRGKYFYAKDHKFSKENNQLPRDYLVSARK